MFAIAATAPFAKSAPKPLVIPRRPLTLDQLRERVIEPVLAATHGGVVLGRSIPCYGFQLTSGGPARALHRSILVRLRPSAVRIYVVKPHPSEFTASSEARGRLRVRLSETEADEAVPRHGRLLFRVNGIESATALAARVRPFLQRIVDHFFRQEVLLAGLHQLLGDAAVATEVLEGERTTHTEIRARGRVALTFDAGLRDDAFFGLHFVEIRDRRRLPAAFQALARFAGAKAWSVDASTLYIEHIPLPTADVARSVGARLAELPWRPSP